MSLGSMLGGVTDAIGLTDTGAAGNAYGAQSDAAAQAQKTLMEMFSQAKDLYQPYIQGGQQSFQDLLAFNKGIKNFEDADGHFKGHSGVFGKDDFEKDPGYNFRMREGQKAIERQQAAMGGGASGRALKALARYGQGFASNEFQNSYNRFNQDYGNAYNRYNQNNSNKFNRLNTLSGYGSNAAGNLAQMGMGSWRSISRITNWTRKR
jgi:hypothetical protein